MLMVIFLSCDLDVVVEPGVVRDEFFVDVLHGVEAGGAAGILVEGVVDLAFVAFGRPAVFLIFGGEVDAAVGVFLRHHLGFELEVLELRAIHFARVKDVGAAAFDMDRAIRHAEGGGVLLIHLPAGEVLAIEEGLPAVLRLLGAGGEEGTARAAMAANGMNFFMGWGYGDRGSGFSRKFRLPAV